MFMMVACALTVHWIFSRRWQLLLNLLVSTWYCSYCCETESLDLVFLMMSKEEGFYVQERPSYINVLGRKSVSGSEC